MRLTLRTLLAYLDDRLSPANARELGQKIVQSPFATELEDRIKNVVRRRRLAANENNHKSIDANLIAEYLDDQLTPELVALIEKEILGSDHSLAEVAASHQILGLLSDPVEISDRLKDRLHKLNPVQESADPDETQTDASNEDWTPLAPQSVAQKRSPMLLLLVMVLGWLVLLFTDSHFFNSSPDDNQTLVINGGGQNVDPLVQNGNAPDARLPENAVADATNEPDSNASVTSPAPTVDKPVDVAANNVTEQPATTDAPATTTPMTNADSNSETTPTTTPSATDTATSDVPASTTTTQNPKPAKLRVTDLDWRDDHRMLILHDAETGRWNWAAGNDPDAADPVNVPAESIAGVPGPFMVDAVDRKTGWSVKLLGPVTFQSASSESPGFGLLSGRAVLRQQTDDAQKPFLLSVPGSLLKVKLSKADARVGLAVAPIPTMNAIDDVDNDVDLTALSASAAKLITIFAADESVSVTVDSPNEQGIEIVIPRGQSWIWNTRNAVPAMSDLPQQIPAPEWIFQSTQPLPPATEQLLTDTATGFRKETTVASAASTMSENKNPQFASFGVRLSSLTRNIEQLSSFLLNSEEEVVRKEAIAGLRTVILQSAAGRDQVASALEIRLSQSELENAMKMLAGVPPVAAEDESVSGWLVEMLSSNRVAMRELAITNLQQLTNEGNGYFADDDSGRRAAAVRRWERYLDRNDGRLLAPPQ